MGRAALDWRPSPSHGEIDASYTTPALAACRRTVRAWRDAHRLSTGATAKAASTWAGACATWSTTSRPASASMVSTTRSIPDPAGGTVAALRDRSRGGARLNNIQDQTDYSCPMARHTTYWSWRRASGKRDRRVHVGARGRGLRVNMADDSDHAATVLWHHGITPVTGRGAAPEQGVGRPRALLLPQRLARRRVVRRRGLQFLLRPFEAATPRRTRTSSLWRRMR